MKDIRTLKQTAYMEAAVGWREKAARWLNKSGQHK